GSDRGARQARSRATWCALNARHINGGLTPAPTLRNALNTEQEIDPMRVLIIEDDPGIADGLTLTLKQAGYAVDGARTLTEARTAISVEHFDLILLDLGLPDGDGL
ncbi:response regulator, partial [Arthrospira platensis SPKY1]|nr:response regulator [Arthrospira platensis SPKY1]